MKKNKLNILWTNADPQTAKFMVMMYATASMNRGFFEEVRVIIWGATAKLVAENKEVQQMLQTAREAGVEFSACLACAEKLNVVSELKQLDIELMLWGQPLTDIIKSEEHLITI